MSIPLYISDLDGTLLRPDGALSDYSRDGLNGLIADGMHFTVATARSVVSIRQLLQGLQLSLPVINLNGARFPICTAVATRASRPSRPKPPN